MYVVMNRIYLKPEYAEAFEERFRQRAGLVDRRPGFVRNQVLRPEGENQPYVVMTFWQSQANFEAWVNSEEFRQSHGRGGTLPGEAYARASELETFTVIQDSQG